MQRKDLGHLIRAAASRGLVISGMAAATIALAGCDQVSGMLGIENIEQINAKKDAESRAIGSACRHAMRAIEDCYALNPKTIKASVFAGWREMDEYMRENKLEGVAPVVARGSGAAGGAGKAEASSDTEDSNAGKSGKSEKSDKSEKSAKGSGH
jgi:hypothetical protein